MSTDFTLKEMYDGARKLKRHKAPGEDQIVAEWMKMLLPFNEEGDDDFPNKMAQVLWKLLNAIWRGEYVPTCWRTTSLVSIFKKGDPSTRDG